jgi:hypothetical protein
MKNWALTDLGATDSVYLTIDRVKYKIARFAASFAINQMPEAVCLLAVGRDANDVSQAAQANLSAANLRQMLPAQVWLNISGEFNTEGTKWPTDDAVMIFDGYLVGTGYQKSQGKVYFTVNLIHWLADLSFSSCLSARSHTSNNADMTFRAAAMQYKNSSSNNQPAINSEELGAETIKPWLGSDIWTGLKSFLCAIASDDGFNPECVPNGADSTWKDNSKAKSALARIEDAFAKDCHMDPKYSVPLPLQIDANGFAAISLDLNQVTFQTIWHMTVWDVIINQYCPFFRLALCPGIDRAIVVADLSCYRTKQWRTLGPDAYQLTDQSLMLPRPLRAVVISGTPRSDNGATAGQNGLGLGGVCIVGSYASKDDADKEGVIMYRPCPSWITSITLPEPRSQVMSGVGTNNPISSAMSIMATVAAAAAAVNAAPVAQKAANLYAQSIFNAEQLRGRGGTISGKLRFDIAPGSHLLLKGSPELFLKAQDHLADDMYGQVNRVTIEIDSEARQAGTSFVLTDLRNKSENQTDRTSAAVHALYGDNVVAGFPLTPEFEFKDAAALED